jgi:predicted RNase H-like HicB family nuclease
MAKNFLSAPQAAAKLGIHRSRMDVLLRAGRIPGAVMVGGRWLIPGNFKVAPAQRKIRKQGGWVKYKIILHPADEGGFAVTVPGLPGCISEGHTEEEAIANIKDAIREYLIARELAREAPGQSREIEVAL